MVSLACIAAMASRHKVSQYMRAAFGSRNEVINDDAISATTVTAVAIECRELLAQCVSTQAHSVILSIPSFLLRVALTLVIPKIWINHILPSPYLNRPVALMSKLSDWIFFPIPALLKVYQLCD
jgi:hypothetical protein